MQPGALLFLGQRVATFLEGALATQLRPRCELVLLHGRGEGQQASERGDPHPPRSRPCPLCPLSSLPRRNGF